MAMPSMTASRSTSDEEASTSQASPPRCKSHRLVFAAAESQGHRQYMEDRYITHDLSGHPLFEPHCQRALFCAVLDGHAGAEAAQYLKEHLLEAYLKDDSAVSEPLVALQNALQQCEQQLLQRDVAAGSTALCILLLDDNLYIANVGDSRAVLSCRPPAAPRPDADSETSPLSPTAASGPMQLTNDHNPSESSVDWARLERAGVLGHISHGYLHMEGLGSLGVSRDLGSARVKQHGVYGGWVVATPELQHVAVSEQHEFVVLGTDGLWEQMVEPSEENPSREVADRRREKSNRDVVNRVRNQLDKHGGDWAAGAAGAAALLVSIAVQMRRQYESSDNVTAVVVLLNYRGQQCQMRNSNSMLRLNLKQ